MKTTLDIPDKLYREFKAKTATNGEKMRSAVISFIVAYNAGGWPQSATRERQTRASQRTRPRLPEWAGMAVPFIKRYPGAPLDSEKMRDEIVAARKDVRCDRFYGECPCERHPCASKPRDGEARFC